jgi:hypothetical protein
VWYYTLCRMSILSAAVSLECAGAWKT